MPRNLWTLLRRVVVTLIAFASVAIDFHGNPSEYFSYFTVLTNLGIGLWFLVSLWQPACDRASELRLGLTIYGLVTLTVYWLVLSPTHHPQGWNFVANLGLHLVVPLAIAIEDIVKPWPPLRLGRVAWILVFPIAYCAFAVVRGEVTGWFPYFFLNPTELGGWGGLSAAIAALLTVFVLLALGWRALVHHRHGTQR